MIKPHDSSRYHPPILYPYYPVSLLAKLMLVRYHDYCLSISIQFAK